MLRGSRSPIVPVAAAPPTACRPSRSGTGQGVRPPRQEAGTARTRKRRVAAVTGRQLHDGARRDARDPGPERLGQVDAGPPAVDAAAPRRRQRPRVRPRRLHGAACRAAARQPRLGRGDLLQEDVRAENLQLRLALLRDEAAAIRATRSPRSWSGSASRTIGATSRWRTSRAGCSRRSRSRGRCCRPRRCCCCWTSRRPGSIRARSWRSRSSSARCGRRTTRRSSSARTTSAEAEALADRIGMLDRGELLALETVPRAEAATAPRRSRRRSSPPPGGRSRRRSTTDDERAGGVRLMRAVQQQPESRA